ncbi:hypothetical protein [Pelobacter propionicus]|uniref:hypothetical protein n=1 Tax=Pelobacter propionicus TaxID=29543 RepID=UPI0005A2AA00|nr:hypothetical protein [Pelobacter propionicus]
MATPAPCRANHPGRPKLVITTLSNSDDRVQKKNEQRRPWALRTDPVKELATPIYSMMLIALLLLIKDTATPNIVAM